MEKGARGREQDGQGGGGKQNRRRFGTSRTVIPVAAAMSERSDGGSLRGSPPQWKKAPLGARATGMAVIKRKNAGKSQTVL